MTVEWEMPEWMMQCIDSYEDIYGRPPTTMELLLWKEATASVRLERG